jgi:glycerol kinase
MHMKRPYVRRGSLQRRRSIRAKTCNQRYKLVDRADRVPYARGGTVSSRSEAVLAVDAGTTGVTALLIDHDASVVGYGYREIPQYYPAPGWVEHDAEEIWRAVLEAVGAAIEASGHDVIAVGVASQRETCLFWERESGRPLQRAIVWQCRRSAAICEELRSRGLEAEIQRRTGLRLDPYLSGTKALWLRRKQPELAARIDAGYVAFGTIDSWLAYKLSGGRVHATDLTNASRTLAFDIEKLDWDEGLLELFGLARRVMPEVRPSAADFGQTSGAGGIPDGLPITALVGDQQAALFGQACMRSGLTKATYGTGCFILTHTGRQPVYSRRGLVTTIAATTDGSPAYALEGSIFIAGAALGWLRDNLGMVGDWHEGELIAATVPDAGGVVFVPAFVGLGSPHWHQDPRGAIYGLTRGTTRAHIVRAALDSMVYQAQDVLAIMAEEAGGIEELRVDGGAAANDGLMQLQADLTGVDLSRPHSVESTAMGAGFLAGLSAGFWRDEAEIEALRGEDRRFLPSKEASAAVRGYERWRIAMEGLLATRLPATDNG